MYKIATNLTNQSQINSFIKFIHINQIDMSNIILDPMCLVGISTYHQKKLPSGLGASIGILYALQKQLTYKISLSSPLGTNAESAQEIVNRLIEYEAMKSKKAKNNVNFYDEYTLVGWYFMGNKEKYYDTDVAKFTAISQAFCQRGAPYQLLINNKGQPTLLKDNQKVKYLAQMETLQKYCSDTLYYQSSKDESPVEKTLKKQQHIIEMYNDKLKKLQGMLKDCDDEKRRQILELLETYERMEHFNGNRKAQVSESMNYSILNGLILSHRSLKQEGATGTR